MKKENNFSIVFSILKKYKKYFFANMLVQFIFYELGYYFLLPFIFKYLIDGISGNTFTYWHAVVVIFYYSFADFSYLFSTVKTCLHYLSTFKVMEDIRLLSFIHTIKQSTSFFNNNFVGTLGNKIKTVSDSIEDILEDSFDITRALLITTCYVVYFLIIDIKIGCMVFVWLLLSTVITILLYRREYRKNAKAQTEYENITDLISDSIINVSNIKNFSSSTYEEQRLLDRDKYYMKKKRKSFLADGDVMLFHTVSMMSIFLLIMPIMFKMFFNHQITTGTVFLIFDLCNKIISLTKDINEGFMDICNALGEFNNGMELFKVHTEIIDKQNAKQLNVEEGKIEFKNIGFKY